MAPRDDIEALRAENAFLRSELGLIENAQLTARLKDIYGLRPSAARLLGTLHRVRGRVLTKNYLVEAIGSAEECGRTVDVLVFKIRQALGHDAVETLVGQGIRIGPAGIAAVEFASMAQAA